MIMAIDASIVDRAILTDGFSESARYYKGYTEEQKARLVEYRARAKARSKIDGAFASRQEAIRKRGRDAEARRLAEWPELALRRKQAQKRYYLKQTGQLNETPEQFLEWKRKGRELLRSIKKAEAAANPSSNASRHIRKRASSLLNLARSRAKKLSLPCTITLDEISRRISHGVCEATGLKFEIARGKGRLARSPSLDRIDPKLGYTPENTAVVCWQHNAAKADFGIEDVLTYALALVSRHRLLTTSQ